MIETEYHFTDVDEKGREVTRTITAYRSGVDPSVVFKDERDIEIFACSGYPERRPELTALLNAVKCELEAFDD